MSINFDACNMEIPWVVQIKYAFKNEIDGWLSSIAWFYGIITGIVIAFYGFLIT